MRLCRAYTLWECEAEWERDGKRSLIVYEPLETHAPGPEWAKPYCCYFTTVIFHDWNRKEITRCEHYDLTAAPSPHLLYLDRRWWEVAYCKIEWRKDQWYAAWHVFDNTLLADRMNRTLTAQRAELEALAT